MSSTPPATWRTKKAPYQLNRSFLILNLVVHSTEPVEILIGELPVVEDGKVVGLLVLKDLLRSGIL